MSESTKSKLLSSTSTIMAKPEDVSALNKLMMTNDAKFQKAIGTPKDVEKYMAERQKELEAKMRGDKVQAKRHADSARAVVIHSHAKVIDEVKQFFAQGKIDGQKTINLAKHLYDLVRVGQIHGKTIAEKLDTIVKGFRPERPKNNEYAEKSEFAARNAMFMKAVHVAVCLGAMKLNDDPFALKDRIVQLPPALTGKQKDFPYSITAAAELCKTKNTGGKTQTKGDKVSKRLKDMNTMFDNRDNKKSNGKSNASQYNKTQIEHMVKLVATLQVIIDNNKKDELTKVENAKRNAEKKNSKAVKAIEAAKKSA